MRKASNIYVKYLKRGTYEKYFRLCCEFKSISKQVISDFGHSEEGDSYNIYIFIIIYNIYHFRYYINIYLYIDIEFFLI